MTRNPQIGLTGTAPCPESIRKQCPGTYRMVIACAFARNNPHFPENLFAAIRLKESGVANGAPGTLLRTEAGSSARSFGIFNFVYSLSNEYCT